MNDFPVDVVYTWVNNSDPGWFSKKEHTLKKYNVFHHDKSISGNIRFRNNDELKFSLRSIEKFCPWIRYIYIITDNQTPTWLNTTNNKIKIIDHKELFDNKKCLPTFNAFAIETKLHHINGLSNNFLYLNDDVFIGRSTSQKDFFYKEGKPKIYMKYKKSILKLIKLRINLSNRMDFINKQLLKKFTTFQYGVFNSKKLIYDKFKVIFNEYLIHGVKSLNKETLYMIEKEFENASNITAKNQFRDNSDTCPTSLHAFYLIANKLNNPLYMYELNRINFINQLYPFVKHNHTFAFVRLTDPTYKLEQKFSIIKKYKPLTFCLNDWPEKNNIKDKIIRDFLLDLFPEKSQYEK